MKVYVPSGAVTVIIDRGEATGIEAEFDKAWMSFHIDEALNIVTIKNEIDGSAWSKDVASIKNEAGAAVGNAAAIRAYLEGIKAA